MISAHNSYVMAHWLVSNHFSLKSADKTGVYVTAQQFGRSDEELEQLAREFRLIWSIAAFLGGRLYMPKLYLKIIPEKGTKDDTAVR